MVPLDWGSEFDSPATIEAIASALRAGGHTVVLVEATASLPAWFAAHAVDLVFNIAEGSHGAYRESQVPAILESLGIPFTGSGSLTLALALDKAKTKQVLASVGLNTPAWQVFTEAETPLNPALIFPLIVKPNCEGSAKGIWQESVVWDVRGLRRQVQRILAQYRQEVLVEEFIEGTELTVAVLGNRDPQSLPVLEIDFASCQHSGERFYSWRMKEYQGRAELGLTPTFHCPARVSSTSRAQIQAIAVLAHQALGCRDLSRTDIRLRRDGTLFVLEVNPLPGLDPVESNFPLIARAAGLSFSQLIHQLVELALARDRALHATRTTARGRMARGGASRVPVASIPSEEVAQAKGSAEALVGDQAVS